TSRQEVVRSVTALVGARNPAPLRWTGQSIPHSTDCLTSWPQRERERERAGCWRIVISTLVAPITSRILSSNAAVSSACFWLCSAIFSLNFRGLAIVVVARTWFCSAAALV